MEELRKNENPQSGYSVSQFRFKPITSGIQIENVTIKITNGGETQFLACLPYFEKMEVG
jgi:hypothetical protein